MLFFPHGTRRLFPSSFAGDLDSRVCLSYPSLSSIGITNLHPPSANWVKMSPHSGQSLLVHGKGKDLLYLWWANTIWSRLVVSPTLCRRVGTQTCAIHVTLFRYEKYLVTNMAVEVSGGMDTSTYDRFRWRGVKCRISISFETTTWRTWDRSDATRTISIVEIMNDFCSCNQATNFGIG